MGAYLSEPITKKEVDVEEDSNFWVSSASMQGWRVSQEDAHNAILNYDDYSSLFAVYDGHGGHEVAVYTAQRLPNFIKGRKKYRMGQLEEGLVEAFVEFDRTLIERDVIRELRVIAGKEAADEEVDHDEVHNLYQEATMPIEAVMAAQNGEEEGQEPCNKSKKSALTQFKTRNGGTGSNSKPISPFLRAKQDPKTPGDDTPSDDASTKLSFTDDNGEKESETKVIKNGSIDKDDKEESATDDSENNTNNGHSNEDTKTDDTEANGKNGNHEVTATNGQNADIKGKGKGKGKGKSSQIVKAKPLESDPDQDLVPEESPKKPKVAKSALELYQNLVNDEVMEEESEEDDDDEKYADEDDDDDDDEDEDDEEQEESEEEEEEDTADEDEDEDDGQEIIGGDFNEEPGNDSGCTAVVALLVGRDLYVANAGDSRCVVCRNGKAIEMSFDHKPEDEPERNRITKAGGRVTPDGRVNGGLNLSRAIGDHAYKTNKDLPLTEQMISPVPDVKKLTIDPDTDSFIFLACDGIWNSLNSQEVVEFINDRLQAQSQHDSNKLTKIIEELFDHCLAPDTMGDGTGCDNMTAVLAKLKPGAFNAAPSIVKSDTEPADSKVQAKRPLEESSEESASKKAKTEDDVLGENTNSKEKTSEQDQEVANKVKQEEKKELES